MNWKKTILIALFLCAFSAAAFAAYQKGQANALQNHMENQYQRAFHEMTFQMDLLHDEIGSTLAMNGGRTLSPALTEVWRLTSMIHSDIGQLPLGILPFSEMEKFLMKIGEFSYRTSVRDLSSEPLTDSEYEKLEQLYSQSADIQNELRSIQSRILEEELTWLDLEELMATGDVKAQPVVDGFAKVDGAVKGYASETFAPTEQETASERRRQLQHLAGERIDQSAAPGIAEKFSGNQLNDPVVSQSMEGSSYPFITVRDSDSSFSMDLSLKGGYPLYMIKDREIPSAALSLNEAVTEAEKFLQRNQLNDLKLEKGQQTDNSASLTFSRYLEEKDVWVLDDSVYLKVALDDGEILGFTGYDYWAGHGDIKVPEAELTEDEALSLLHSEFENGETRLTLIRNEFDEHVLCYEFTGITNDETFRIYINAINGQEEKVEKL
ncbi:germination protein YpeB [Jeotgalibacillus haloalkalitolerans]|uniref:Germination protein YpeB n=1 Tax=Jeotgalibacillus haloalkalitolerans TaxID=3104292 RepID=A0ABU5KL87_9BACL|nr:germination protein YpeB [Jeotgalibacillus sp. HH7-29]MDZ5712029.1 germination protein YpeB [Jeotgalibacillus sp. HH7-29]